MAIHIVTLSFAEKEQTRQVDVSGGIQLICIFSSKTMVFVFPDFFLVQQSSISLKLDMIKDIQGTMEDNKVNMVECSNLP